MLTREKTVKICEIAIDWLILAAVFFIPLCFAFAYEVYSIFVLYKVVCLRVLVSLIAIFYLVKIFLEGKITYRFRGWILWIIVLLAASWFISSLLAVDRSLGFWGLYNRQQGFFTLIFYLLFFLLLILNLNNFSQIKRLLGALLFSSSLVCLYGLIQHLQLDPLKWQETDRIFSTLGQPNFLGHFLALVIPITVYAIFFQARRFLARSLFLLLLLAETSCLLFTSSRSALLALGTEVFLAALLVLFYQGRKKAAAYLAISFLLLMLVVGCLSSALVKRMAPDYSSVYRILAIFNLDGGSVKMRINFWRSGLAEFREESFFRQVFGRGPENLGELFARRYQPSWAIDERINTWPDRAHNSFLDIVLSFGLLGLSFYFLFLFYLFWRLWIYFKTAVHDEKFWLAVCVLVALGGYSINNIFSFSDTVHFLFFYLFCGWLVFLFSRIETEKELAVRLSPLSRLVIFIFVFIFLVIGIFYVNSRLVLADYHYMKSIKASYGDCADVLDENKKAVGLGGGNSIFYQGEYVFNSLNCFNKLADGGAREKVKENMRWYLSFLPVENNFHFAKYKADAEAVFVYGFGEKDYYSQAERDFAILAEKYPYLSFVYEDWANFEFRSGNYEATVKAAEAGIKTLPLEEMEKRKFVPHRAEIESQLARFYDFLGAAYEQLKRDDRALEYYKKIIRLRPYYLENYGRIADIYQRQKNWGESLWYNERGYMLDRNNYAWPLAIAFVYKEKGDKESAKKYAGKAMFLSPDNKNVSEFLETLEP